jgi:uncharacterized protein (DUF1501 family)
MSSSYDCHACREYNELSRRQFLRATGGAALLAGSAPAWLPRVVFARDDCSDRDVIVHIYLRGGCDGLTLCVPYGEAAYYEARPSLAIGPPDDGDPNAAADLDGFFGLPPALRPLLEVYADRRLLIVHATGSTDPSRSHFDAQRFMEVGKPNDPTIGTGWLGRHLLSVPPMDPNALLRAVGLATGLQQTLAGGPLTLPIPDLDRFGLGGNSNSEQARRAALADMYAQVEDPLRAAAETTLVTIDMLDAIDFANYVPDGGAVYPDGAFGYAIKSTAALIKAEVGVEAVSIDIGGWDTHNNQGPIAGPMAALMTSLAGGLSAFYTDMWTARDRNIILVVVSEFGRRVAENGSAGTDHGHGNVILVLGKYVRGGRVLTRWPGLEREQLFQGMDLEVTIDYRDVLAEIVARRLKNAGNLDFVFPDYTPKFHGVVTPLCPDSANPAIV